MIIKKGAMMRTITRSYEIISPESAEMGEVEETGWYDSEGYSCEPDSIDKEGGLSCVDIAVTFLRDHGITEPSSSSFWPGTWYMSIDPDRNYETSNETYYHAFLNGFTESEEQFVFEHLTQRKR